MGLEQMGKVTLPRTVMHVSPLYTQTVCRESCGVMLGRSARPSLLEDALNKRLQGVQFLNCKSIPPL